jgi:hypothetical protein
MRMCVNYSFIRPDTFTLEDIAVEKQQGVEGLVLRGGRHATAGQAGEEGFDLPLGGQVFELRLLEKGAVATQPVGLALFRVD